MGTSVAPRFQNSMSPLGQKKGDGPDAPFEPIIIRPFSERNDVGRRTARLSEARKRSCQDHFGDDSTTTLSMYGYARSVPLPTNGNCTTPSDRRSRKGATATRRGKTEAAQSSELPERDGSSASSATPNVNGRSTEKLHAPHIPGGPCATRRPARESSSMLPRPWWHAAHNLEPQPHRTLCPWGKP